MTSVKVIERGPQGPGANWRGDYSPTAEYYRMDYVVCDDNATYWLNQVGPVSGIYPPDHPEVWAVGALPGDITPELDELRDGVQSDRAAVAQYKVDVAADKAAVTQLKADTQADRDAVAQYKVDVAADKAAVTQLKADTQADRDAVAVDRADTHTDKLAADVARTGAETARALAEAARDIAVTASFSADSWVTLSGITPTVIGQRAVVSDVDAGTHTGRTAGSPGADVSGVLNAGAYGAYALTAGAWRRDGDDVTVAVAGNSAALRVLEESGNAEARFLSRAANRAAAWPRSLIVILLGQSLNAPREGGAPVVSGAPAGSRMMAGGASVTAFAYNATNAEWCTNWSDVATDAPFTEGGGQTPLAGVAAALAGGRWARVYLASAAVGARGVNILSGSGLRANIQALVKRFVAISRSAGFEADVVFYSAHGEADAFGGMSEASYYNLAASWYRNCQLIAAQALERPDYVAPVLLTYPVQTNSGSGGDKDRAIKAAIKQVARDLPGGVDLGAIYQWPVDADRVHPTVASYVKRGEAVGRAIREYFDAGRVWGQALQIVDVTLSGASFVATFNGEVVRDDSLGVGQNLNTAVARDGMEWVDNGTPIAITALTYSGRRVTGALASAPVGTIDQQVLRIASQATDVAFTAGSENVAGSVIRAAGDGWRSINYPDYVNHIWAAPQVFNNVRSV